jgi:hypothetical protein
MSCSTGDNHIVGAEVLNYLLALHLESFRAHVLSPVVEWFRWSQGHRTVVRNSHPHTPMACSFLAIDDDLAIVDLP